MSAVSLQNIFFKIESTWILNGVSLQIEKGSIFALCGPSGSGKTTLCEIILGAKKIYSGSLSLFEDGNQGM